jgi:hypothetical protein
MDAFDKAQKLFKEYEKNGVAKSLEEAIEILDGIIKKQGPDSHRATNLKSTIGKYLDAQVRNICARCNIEDYINNLKSIDDLISFLNGSLKKEDAIRFIKLFSMLKKYFEVRQGGVTG